MGRASEAFRLMLVADAGDHQWDYLSSSQYKHLRRLNKWRKTRNRLAKAKGLCPKKGKYGTWVEAQQALIRQRKKYPVLKNCYWCLPCECYHLTSMTLGEMKKIKGF